jgi:4a-hydroxytetrahydrobiopterin dehydratase
VADAAEKQDHHPDIFISYDHVRLTLSTHKMGGLSRSDFVLATRIDALSGNDTSSAAGK